MSRTSNPFFPSKSVRSWNLKSSFYSLLVLAFVAFQFASCSGDAVPDPDPTPDPNVVVVVNQDSITAERTVFWNAWVDSCFPGRDWDTSSTTFTTFGINYDDFKAANPALDATMASLFQTPAYAASGLPTVINSGITVPTTIYANQGDKFYKIVPKGNTIINSYSVYYLTRDDLDLSIANVAYLEQRLGLPLASVDADYDVFAITSTIDSNVLFQSTVAAATQYANATPLIVYPATGGATQTLIINNSSTLNWIKDTIPTEAIIPDVLPIIE